MTKTLLPLAVLAALPVAAAQSSQPSADMRARMAQMQPVMDLAQTVRLLPELEKNKATAMTKAQAGQLLTLIGTLQKATTIKAADAKKYLTQIEDKILNDRQLSALDTLMIKAEEARNAERAKRQGAGTTARVPGMPGLPGTAGQRTQGANGPSGTAPQAFDPNKFNPFKTGRDVEALKAYVALLKKK